VQSANVSSKHHGHRRQVADGVQDPLVDRQELTHLRRGLNRLLQGQPITRLLLDPPPLHRDRLPTAPAGMTQKIPGISAF
jgi:hypothetical protein